MVSGPSEACRDATPTSSAAGPKLVPECGSARAPEVVGEPVPSAVASNVAPSGKPVVSTGITPIATVVCSSDMPHREQQPPSAVGEPQRGQTIGQLVLMRD